jgi:hypothetical protein
MSAWLITVGIPASILAFYPVVISLAQLPLFRQNTQLPRRLHIGGWGLTLLLLACFLAWGISLRGQWLDALPFSLAWLAAGTYFWLCRKRLTWAGQLYFGGWFGYPAALALAYFTDRIFFALVAFPLFVFFPATTYYSSTTVTLRDPVGGFLAARRMQLLTPLGFVFEKHVGLTADSLLFAESDSITKVSLQPDWRPDSVKALIITHRGQRVVRFGR